MSLNTGIFLSLEEIDEEEYFDGLKKNQVKKRKVSQNNDYDWDSFVHIDEFKDKVEAKKVKKLKILDQSVDVSKLDSIKSENTSLHNLDSDNEEMESLDNEEMESLGSDNEEMESLDSDDEEMKSLGSDNEDLNESDANESENSESSNTETLELKDSSDEVQDSLNVTEIHDISDIKLQMKDWNAVDLHPKLIRSLFNQKFTSPTEIQSKTLVHSIKYHKDIIGAAETGSGKTLAFGLPILNCLALNDYKTDGVTALILVPTRELALQVTDHLKSTGELVTKKIVTIVGGMFIEKQKRLMDKIPDIVVATPGRLGQLLSENDELAKSLLKIRFLVLDEADRMLEAGHFKDLDAILESISNQKLTETDIRAVKRQTFVFSATMIQDDVIKQSVNRKAKKSKKATNALFGNLIEKIEFRDKEPIYINLSRKEVTAKGVLESKIDCIKTEKDLMLYYVLCRYSGKTIVFVNSIDAIRRLVPLFSQLKENVFGIHAEMQQKQRLKNLERFTDAEDAVLIASDVASRGLDIPNVDHVIHYQLPRAADIYVHRAGRTARGLNHEGVSVMLCCPEELTHYKKICFSLKKENGVPDFPVDLHVTQALKARLTLARQLDQLLHKNKKKQTEIDWFKKAAEEADILMSDDEDEEIINEQKSKHTKQVQKLRHQLDTLIKKPLIPKGISARYITSNVTGFADIAIRAKGNILPTVDVTKATQDLKHIIDTRAVNRDIQVKNQLTGVEKRKQKNEKKNQRKIAKKSHLKK
ncbi:ATP-dependent RNA helicase [Globomyces sp. JEL0801]|nr:ATP-dependent RNA helicase [Globomyces sp. JEL0801]